MVSEPADTNDTAPAKGDGLGRVLRRSRRIKDTIRQAARRLTSVNAALKHRGAGTPAHTINEAIAQNEEVEGKVAAAAKDLSQVNSALAAEVAERADIESELVEVKSDLTEARNDLSESQVAVDAARHSALHDPLTGLPNRELFEETLDQGLALAKRHGWGIAVLFIDVDEFKGINDTHGHDVGDKVLCMVADRLRSAVRDEDMISRWGGDEFACILLEVAQESDVILIAEDMAARIAEDRGFDESGLTVRVSIGVALYPADGETSETLLKSADTAMYSAKGTGRRVAVARSEL